MKTMTFLINGAATGNAGSKAWVTINEMEGGKLTFKVVQSGDATGSLRGAYFDVDDENILNTIRIDTASNDSSISDNLSKKLGVVTKMDGASCEGNEHSLGLGVKKYDTGKKNTSSYSFTISSTKRKLVLGDFSKIQLDHSVINGASYTPCNDEYSYRWLYMGFA